MSVKTPKSHVTLADVARAAGVAKSTASHVFTGRTFVAPHTAARVRAAALELGYAGPSALGRALAHGKSHVVAVMTRALLENPDTDPFSLQVIDGLAREFAAHGYGTVLLPPIADDASRTLADSVVFDAVVTVRRMEGFAVTDPYLHARHVPWLSLDGDNDEHLAVETDDAAAVVELLGHLRDLGHTRVGVVTLRFSGDEAADGFVDFDDARLAASPNIARRLNGFVDAGVAPVVTYKCGFVAFENGLAAGRAFAQLPHPPTAIVCMSDLHAAGVITALQEAGVRVPEEVSVTGFDGLPLTRMAPLRLTTVVQDGVEKGRASARYLMRRLAGESPAPERLALHVRVGNTTGPAPRTP